MDDMSRAIGQLETELRLTRLKLEDVDDKLDAFSDLPGRLSRLEPMVEDYARMRQRGIGLMLGLSLAAGSAGAYIRDLLKLFHG